MRAAPALRRRRIAACAAACALVAAAPPGEQDASHWIGRMEAALLPQAALRAEGAIETTTRVGGRSETRVELMRVEGPQRLRTLVTVWEEDEPVRIERLVFDGTRLRRSVFRSASRVPVESTVDRTDRFGETEFSYEDLAFTDFAPRERGEVERVAGRDSDTIQITTEPGYGGYGKVVTRLDADLALPVEVLFFDDAGRLFRTLRFDRREQEGPYTLPMRAVVENQASGRTSRLTLDHAVIGATIYEHEFGDVHVWERLQESADESTAVEPYGF